MYSNLIFLFNDHRVVTVNILSMHFFYYYLYNFTLKMAVTVSNFRFFVPIELFIIQAIIPQ